MRLLAFFSFLLLIAVSSCETETVFVSGDSVNLRFEVDTLHFDTVFASVGSATRFFKVYNQGNKPIKIDRIEVAGMTGVDFSINVDGVQGPLVENTTIYDNDSIYVFVEVTVDPTAPENVSPFITEDQIIFTTGSKTQDVKLLAFGQNANYIGSIGTPIPLPCEADGVINWTADLPYVIYGELFVNDCTLEMAPGTRVYIHGGVARNEQFGVFNDGFIYALSTGKIHILGDAENPVIIQTDRLETPYQDEPGQYLGLIFGPESTGNIIRHARILHGIQGVIADSLSEVSLENTVIAYTLGSAISGRNATVSIKNCLFHSNFGNTVQFIQGVRLNMDHTTIANYGTDASALALQNFECFPADNCENASVVVPVEVNIRNSILSGSRSDELLFANGVSDRPDLFQVNILNSVVRVDDLLTQQEGLYANFFENNCSGCYNLMSRDPLFVSVDEDDYHLDTLSVAERLGEVLPGLELDLDGNTRIDSVDAGAFERE